MHAFVYTTSLLFSFAGMIRQYSWFTFALVFGAYILRVNFRASKYLLWISFSLTLTLKALFW
jgi:hypothetical protein